MAPISSCCYTTPFVDSSGSCSGALFTKARADVLPSVIGRQLYRSRAATHVEIAFGRGLESLPLEKHRLRAALAGYDAHRLALDDLGAWVDAGPCAIAEAIAHNLRKVAHELVVVLEPVELNADNRAVVCDPDQQVAAFRVQERGGGLEHGVGDALVILPVRLQVPAQRRLELQRLRFATLDELLCAAVAAQVLVEEEVLHRLAEGAIVGDALVELEVRVDDLLDHLLDLLVEGEPHVLPCIDARCGIERDVVVQLLHHMAERHTVLRAEVQTKPLVQLSDDSREGLEFLWSRPARRPGACWVEQPGLPPQSGVADPGASAQ